MSFARNIPKLELAKDRRSNTRALYPLQFDPLRCGNGDAESPVAQSSTMIGLGKREGWLGHSCRV
jgi:hypothetical protein